MPKPYVNSVGFDRHTYKTTDHTAIKEKLAKLGVSLSETFKGATTLFDKGSVTRTIAKTETSRIHAETPSKGQWEILLKNPLIKRDRVIVDLDIKQGDHKISDREIGASFAKTLTKH